MYIFKQELKENLLEGRPLTYISEKIGLSRNTIHKIINEQHRCKKTTAYCIVKLCNENAEIEDYFIRKDK